MFPGFAMVCNPKPLRRLKKRCKKFFEQRAVVLDPIPSTSGGHQSAAASTDNGMPPSLKIDQEEHAENSSRKVVEEMTTPERSIGHDGKSEAAEQQSPLKLSCTKQDSKDNSTKFLNWSFQPKVVLVDIGKPFCLLLVPIVLKNFTLVVRLLGIVGL